ncbi:MAG TPA: biopolymer transporter ExbD [Steroidobacteraceae bacterium]|nr:biopolymer transporter ExbD [Steroidobacteraceae bacterium]
MSSTSHLPDAQINTTPLIDVMLVLLVMLILVVPIATHTVEVNLPHEGTGPPSAPVHLEVMYGGDIFWNGQHVASVEALLPRLAELAHRKNPPLLKVMPEKRAPYERVAQVLAAAQRSKVARMSVMPVPDL